MALVRRICSDGNHHRASQLGAGRCGSRDWVLENALRGSTSESPKLLVPSKSTILTSLQMHRIATAPSGVGPKKLAVSWGENQLRPVLAYIAFGPCLGAKFIQILRRCDRFGRALGSASIVVKYCSSQ